MVKNNRFNKLSKAVFKPKTLKPAMHLYTTVLLEANRSKREKKTDKKTKQANKQKEAIRLKRPMRNFTLTHNFMSRFN